MTDLVVENEVAPIDQEEATSSHFQEIKDEILEENPTVEELRAYAKKEDVGLEGATRKDDIAVTITTAIVIREQLQEEEAGENEKPEPAPVKHLIPKIDTQKPPAVSAESATKESQPAPVKQPITGKGLKTRAAHFKRLIVPTNDVTLKIADAHIEIDTVQSAKAYIEEVYFANGYEMTYVSYIGVETLAEVSGHNIMLIFEQPANHEALHNEIYILITQIGGMSGFQHDAFLSSYLEQGWKLEHFETLGYSEAGINCFWVLVR